MFQFKHIFILFFLLFSFELYAQVTNTPITKSDVIQVVDGKNFIIHKVEKGQTLFSIARTYGVRYQDAVISRDIDKLRVGDTVWIPTKEDAIPLVDIYFNYYEVKKGETLYSLTRRYNISEQELKKINPELDTIGLQAGQVIKIPRLKDVATEELNVIDSLQFVEQNLLAKDSSEAKWEGKIVIRPRKSKQDVHVALMMPFNLQEINMISTSKFDIDQRQKKHYKSFDFIQFYEGILLGLKKLEAKGYGVVLTIYDVEQNDSKKVEELFTKDDVKNADFIISLLYQSAFNTAAKLARENNIFIINPLSKRGDILNNNPYVVKYLPSDDSYAASVLSIVKKNYPESNIVFVHSGKAEEKECLDKFTALLDEQKGLTYSTFAWTAGNQINQRLSQTKKNVIVSLYSKDKQSNTLYATQLLNRIGALKKNPPILFGTSEWLDYPNIDYNYLERLSFYYDDNLSLSTSDYSHKLFINEFISAYNTEPDARFASVGHDLIIHFVTGLHQKNEKFWERPNMSSSDILHPTNYKRTEPSSGFENHRRSFYKIENFKPVPVD